LNLDVVRTRSKTHLPFKGEILHPSMTAILQPYRRLVKLISFFSSRPTGSIFFTPPAGRSSHGKPRIEGPLAGPGPELGGRAEQGLYQDRAADSGISS